MIVVHRLVSWHSYGSRCKNENLFEMMEPFMDIKVFSLNYHLNGVGLCYITKSLISSLLASHATTMYWHFNSRELH